MKRAQLENHLMLQGWYPVAATRAALQRDNERVFIIELPEKNRTTTGHYVHPDVLARSEVPWKDIKTAYLLLLANRIEGLQ